MSTIQQRLRKAVDLDPLLTSVENEINRLKALRAFYARGIEAIDKVLADTLAAIKETGGGGE